MSCCGHKRSQLATPNETARRPRPGATAAGIAGNRRPPPVVTFLVERVGPAGPVTAVGPVTGVTYRFEAPGARHRVDARDLPMLAYQPGLRKLG